MRQASAGCYAFTCQIHAMNYLLLYIDPGSGSFLFQLLIAGFFAVSFYFRRIRAVLTSWFWVLFPAKDKAE